MGFINRALTLDEEIEVAELLSSSGPRTLPFARGVFAAAATAQKPLDPTEYLPLVLGDQVPTSATLRRILSLLVRDANDVAATLAEGTAPVPASTDEDVLREYCRGYVQVAQRDKGWTSNQAAFDLTLPLMVLSGYVEPKSLAAIAPEAAADPAGYTKTCSDRLPGAVLALYDFFGPARAQHAQTKSDAMLSAGAERGKVGRNDPCPCGSGRKLKKCCG